MLLLIGIGLVVVVLCGWLAWGLPPVGMECGPCCRHCKRK